MGEDASLSIEQHPPVRRGLADANAIVLRHPPEFGSLDDLKGPEADEDDQKGQGQKSQKVLMPSFEILHLLGVEFHVLLSLSLDLRSLFCYQENRSLVEEREKDRSDQPRNDRLGKQVDDDRALEVLERGGVKAGDKNKKENPFEKGKDEDEQKLKREALPVEVTSEELCDKKDQRPREGVKPQGVSRKKIYKIAEGEREKSPQDGRVRKP